MESNDLARLSDELIDRMMNNELFQDASNLYMTEEDDTDTDDVIILHMDIREPLRTLQKLVEDKIGMTLRGYKFWLQDAQELEPHKNLVDQCVKGEGLVQINVQIKAFNQRINIVDVLKPTEAALAALSAENGVRNQKKIGGAAVEEESQSSASDQEKASTRECKNIKPCLNWVLDSKFKKEQVKLRIPDDPNDWTVPQVKHWLQWAVQQFDLMDISLRDWIITGKELCSLTHEEFRRKLPVDPGNVFWTHLQLLKECKFVSVVHKEAEQSIASNGDGSTTEMSSKEMRIMRKSTFHSAKNYSPLPSEAPVLSNAGMSAISATQGTYGVGSGNNGQVQLWQFLLEILTDREHVGIIQWVGTDGEFKLTDPERVARLWGEKKNKPAMNYEKLSRALRYYYDGDMISKVSGKRFAYKFDCDLKLLIGYDAAELSQLVGERSYMEDTVYDHMDIQSDEE